MIINISFRENDFQKCDFFNDFEVFVIMYDPNSRKRILLCHGSKQNTVSFEIYICKYFISLRETHKTHDFLEIIMNFCNQK